MSEEIFEGAAPMSEEQKDPTEEAELERCEKERDYFAALKIEEQTFTEFKSEGYETLHKLLESLEEAYELNPKVADDLLHEAYNTIMTVFLEVIEIYAYNKAQSMHFNREIPL